MGTTPICTIDATGIHRPAFADVFTWCVEQFQAIYGSDIVLDSSTQDGELVGLFASAIDDTNAMAVQAYNAFSPATAQGAGLSSVVKINGLARLVPSFSTAIILIVGVANTNISNGLVADGAGNIWALPATVNIPSAGQTVVTATCQTLGAIAAPVNTINQIVNTQPGWQSATNTSAATAGNPVETDAELRVRQSQSTMNSSTAIVQGLQGALLALPGVNRCRVYSNDGNLPDGNNIPGHCIAVVIDGGNVQQIAQTIMAKKGGCGTYGYAFQTITDQYGVKSNINYFSIGEPPITVTVNIIQDDAFTTDIVSEIQNSISNYINGLGIGMNVTLTRLFAPAYLNGAADGNTFEVTNIVIARDGNGQSTDDVVINFYEAPFCLPSYVTVVVS